MPGRAVTSTGHSGHKVPGQLLNRCTAALPAPTTAAAAPLPAIPTSSLSKSCCPKEEDDDNLWNLESLETQKGRKTENYFSKSTTDVQYVAASWSSGPKLRALLKVWHKM